GRDHRGLLGRRADRRRRRRPRRPRGRGARAPTGWGRCRAGVLRRPRRQPALPRRGVPLNDELRDTVRRAYAGSDFFRVTLAAAGVGADGVDELARLPFTTKEQLRAAYPFGWTCVPDREVVRIHASSGTTG